MGTEVPKWGPGTNPPLEIWSEEKLTFNENDC